MKNLFSIAMLAFLSYANLSYGAPVQKTWENTFWPEYYRAYKNEPGDSWFPNSDHDNKYYACIDLHHKYKNSQYAKYFTIKPILPAIDYNFICSMPNGIYCKRMFDGSDGMTTFSKFYCNF